VAGWIAELLASHATLPSEVAECEADIKARAATLMAPLPLYPMTSAL
jgi:hypothetical protein